MPVILLHGFPYDLHSYRRVIPILAEAGFRVITPELRGHGGTRFRSTLTPRTGEQAALGRDVIELMDALGLERAILAGYDWGGRAACVAAALHPDRVAGLVSVNGYLVQDIQSAMKPLTPAIEAGFWYFFYFLTERGRAGLAADRRGIAEVIWRRNSPEWEFDDETLDRAATAFENPDWVDVVVHSYRHRLAQVPGAPQYVRDEGALAMLPSIPVPTITLDGMADGNFPAQDAAVQAAHFTGTRTHRLIPHAGHNLPQERPDEFASAIIDVAALGRVSRRPEAREHRSTV
ncbi:alpha/beta fold hydrolase [Agromyces sp. LHK192]|uniref:alpha/beta fold hydrolase n=1 Tax=Agromyces sp. LHK192 TaxID=2498704 RepID=UPI001F0C83B4|nr:alpha/beta hydrolase [Agromyces sp. LHK192]